MSAQLVFDTPRNRELFNKYRAAVLNNPQWEPEGKVRRGKGIDTVNVNGVEYYKNVSYGIPPYLHQNERPIRFKQVGGKKSQVVSDVLDVAIPKLAKYGLSAAALAGPILAGNPEFAPATLLLASDLHEPLGKKLRKTIKEKTGYGVYNDMEGMGDSLALRRLKIVNKIRELNKIGPSLYKEGEFESRKFKLNSKLKKIDAALSVKKIDAEKAYMEKVKTFKKKVDEEEARKNFLSAYRKRQVKANKTAEVNLTKPKPEKKKVKKEAKKEGGKKANTWVDEVKAYSAAHNVTYKVALKKASEARKNKA